MSDDDSEKTVGSPAYFNLLAEKLRAAGRDVCATCDTDLPPDARPNEEACGPVDCAAKRVRRAADKLQRGGEYEDD